jgi:hypothetical protein
MGILDPFNIGPAGKPNSNHGVITMTMQSHISRVRYGPSYRIDPPGLGYRDRAIMSFVLSNNDLSGLFHWLDPRTKWTLELAWNIKLSGIQFLLGLHIRIPETTQSKTVLKHSARLLVDLARGFGSLNSQIRTYLPSHWDPLSLPN